MGFLLTAQTECRRKNPSGSIKLIVAGKTKYMPRRAAFTEPLPGRRIFIFAIMEHIDTSLILILAGIAVVTILDITGSILSRRLNFSYGHFTILSVTVYTYIAYFMTEKTNSWLATMIVVLVIGFYEGTVGWIISQTLRANYGRAKEIAEKMTFAHTIPVAMIFAMVCGWIGIYLAGR